MLQRLRSVDKHWLSLLLITLLVNVPFLSPQLSFVHDTLSSFAFFHFAYSDLYFHNEFPKWIPLMGYGIPFDFNLFSCLLPTDYVMMAVGWLLGVTDAPLLFKLSVVLSQGVFVMGLYLLTGRLFASRLAVWIVCLGALLTNSWLFNSAWKLAPIYLMPLEFFLLIDFVESRNPTRLWSAAIIELVSLLGAVSYIAPLHLLVLATFLLTLLAQQPKLIGLFLRCRNFIHPLFLVFLGFAWLLGSLVFGMEVVFLSPNRDPQTGNVPLDVFLNLYRYPLAAVLATMVKGEVPIGELIVYVGLLPIFAWGYALVRRQDAYFVSFSAVAVILFWFSLGGWFSTQAYSFVPLMNKFRHISFTMGTFKLFLLLAGGFGFDQLLSDLGWTAGRPPQETGAAPRFRLGRWLLILLAIGCFVDFLVHRRPDDLTNVSLDINGQRTCDQSFSQEWYAPFVLALRLFAYGGLLVAVFVTLRRRQQGLEVGRKLAPVILAIYLADVGFFYLLIIEQAPFCPPGMSMGRDFDARDLAYSQERILRIPPFQPDLPERVDRIRRVIVSPPNRFYHFSSIYSSLYLLMRVDVLSPQLRLDQIMPGVKQMIEARGGLVIGDAPAMILPEEEDPTFLRSLGRDAPKARIVRDVVFAASDEEALRFFTRKDGECKVKDPWQTIVVTGNKPVSPDNRPETSHDDAVEVTYFSANRMVVKTLAKAPGWLFSADAFHPAWHATVNDEPIDVVRANVGCKAVHVPQGASEVAFHFDGGLRDWIRRGVAMMGSLLGFILTASLGVVLFRKD